MAWSFAPRLLRFRPEPPPVEYDEPAEFPAGVVALGRGGAGEIGALLREDGVYVGLLSLAGGAARSTNDVAALAATLPFGECQVVTIRWPVDGDRAAAAWRATARGGFANGSLASEIADTHLPRLVEAGWSEVRTFLAIRRGDPEALRRDLVALARDLPLPARPATLAEAKHLAGDWFAPHAFGLVTIGWSLSALNAEPSPDWARTILEADALIGVPTVLSLQLDPAGSPDPVPFEVHRRLAELDIAIEARRRDGRRGGLSDCDGAEDLLVERRELLASLGGVGASGDRPRPARLLIGCAVDPRYARALRGEVEAVLDGLGFVTSSLGPGRSDDTLLSSAPLGIALVGRGLTLTTRGAALLAPLVPPALAGLKADAGIGRATGLPLGVRRDGGALRLDSGEAAIAVGAAVDGTSAALQTWVLGQLACGTQVCVVDTTGEWGPLARAAGGERVQVALGLGGLIAGLGAGRLRRAGSGPAERQMEAWVATTTALLRDLCPDLAEDELGDLTAFLLTLAEGDLAWGEPVQLAPVIARLRESEDVPARHLAAMLTATGALRPPAGAAGAGQQLVILDAAPDHAGQRIVPPAGCAAVALQAAIDHLAALVGDPRQRRLVVLDDLVGMVEAAAGPGLIGELLALARQVGATVYCAAGSLAACPRGVLDALRDLDPAAILFPCTPEALRATARALDLPPNLFERRDSLVGGEALVVRGEEATAIQIVPLQLAAGHARR